MASFKKRKSNSIDRIVPVVMGDQSQGDLDINVAVITQREYEDVLEQGDHALCKRILNKVNQPIEIEDSEEVIEGDEAKDLVLDDICCVSAICGDYIEAMKTKNFRNAGSSKRR